MLSVTQRAHAYNTAFAEYPASHFMVTDDRWASAQWVMGNNYKTGARNEDGTPFYGAYPPGYLKRVMALFPDAKSVLHLFAGSLPPSEDYVRFGNVLAGDAFGNPLDRRGDAQELSKFYGSESFDLILADPPYSKDDAKRYGTEMVDRRKVLYQCYEVLEPGGNLVWLDTLHPMHRGDMFRLWGLIGITRSTNHRYRQVSIFTRLSDGAKLHDQPLPLQGVEGDVTAFFDESVEEAA